MVKVIFFVPIESAEYVKEAMFSAGAGSIGNYKRCSFETKGFGQFQAMDGANPTIGEIDKLEKVEELRVEMIVDDKYIKNVILALKKSHPYEEPAYDVLKLYNTEVL